MPTERNAAAMPPKKNQPSNKTKEKAKKKAVEDKTFGLKNKNKSAKVNRYVKQVEQQVQSAGNRQKMKEAENRKKEIQSKKEAAAKKEAQLAELFKPAVIQQKVPFGVNPKTVLCANFKQGTCTKGDKCKFSHDQKSDRKSGKIDLYTDPRDAKGAAPPPPSTTPALDADGQPSLKGVCKHFVEAVANGQYGWFWQCPEGGDKCKYRHALPEGYVVQTKEEKKRQKEEDAERSKISLEAFLETERHQLGGDLTPVTFESFAQWRADRTAKALAEKAAKLKSKEAAYRSGKAVAMTGREYFQFNEQQLAESFAANNGDDDEDNVFDISSFKSQQVAADEDDEEQPTDGESAPNADTSSTPTAQLGKDLAQMDLTV
ncbi:Translation machinery-associated protein 46 [Dimargaris xerosporica]|nr:Translation machinery-associated protein 46 [Dimargaris xerosporica]